MKVLNGILYLLKVGHEVADPTKAMIEIAQDARRFNISMIEVEPNFGQGMWVAAFQPILEKTWKGGATVQESEWAKGQKETRIIDTLEPVLTQHRMVVAESFLREDAATEDRNYAFLYQLTHITRDRGALTHDDRVDAVAGAVAHFQRAMMMDVDQAAKAMRDEEMGGDRGLPRKLQSADLSRHAGQWGPGAHLVEPARLERSLTGTSAFFPRTSPRCLISPGTPHGGNKLGVFISFGLDHPKET